MTVVDRNGTKSSQELEIPHARRRYSSVLKDALQETHHFVCCRTTFRCDFASPRVIDARFLGIGHSMPGSYVCSYSYHPSSWAECLVLGPDIGQRCRRCTVCGPGHRQGSSSETRLGQRLSERNQRSRPQGRANVSMSGVRWVY
jgi:hypothetical protein